MVAESDNNNNGQSKMRQAAATTTVNDRQSCSEQRLKCKKKYKTGKIL